MRTDDFIRALAADDRRSMSTSTVLAVALLAAAPLSIAFFVAVLGVRPDFAKAIHSPFFDLKFAVTLSLALPAIVLAIALAQPGKEIGVRSRLLLFPVVLLVIGIACDLTAPQTRTWAARLIGDNALVCLTAIPAMGLPLLIAGLVALRHGAVTRPAAAGSVTGLLAGGLAATVYAAHCTDDSPLFVASWYSVGIAVLSATGAVAGHRVLRL